MVKLCYPLSAVRFPREGVRLSDIRLSDVRLALCLETYSPFMAGHMVQGDFSTPLRCARNDIGEFG